MILLGPIYLRKPRSRINGFQVLLSERSDTLSSAAQILPLEHPVGAMLSWSLSFMIAFGSPAKTHLLLTGTILP